MPSFDAQHNGESLLDRRQSAQRLALLQMQKAAQAVADEFNKLLADTIAEGHQAVAECIADQSSWAAPRVIKRAVQLDSAYRVLQVWRGDRRLT